MADINIERKGPGLWPWLIGLLVLALLIWAVAEIVDTDDEVAVDTVSNVEPVAMPGPEGTQPTAVMPADVQNYLTQCTTQAGEQPAEMTREHQFTVDCLQSLGTSLRALASGGQGLSPDVGQRLDSYNSTVQQLEASDPSMTTHSALTRAAALEAASVMESLRDSHFQDGSGVGSLVSEVRGAAEDIGEETQLLEQREDIREFFREAGEALRAMGEHHATM